MAILNFSDVLKNVGLDPKRVKLIRHSLGDKAFKECYRHNAVSNRFSSHLSTSPTNAATFVSRGCGGYTLGFAQRIAHNGTHGETGGFPSLVHSVVLCCRRYPFYSTTLLYTYISRFSVNPHHQAEGETQAKLPSLTLSPTVSHRVFQLLAQMAHIRFHG